MHMPGLVYKTIDQTMDALLLEKYAICISQFAIAICDKSHLTCIVHKMFSKMISSSKHLNFAVTSKHRATHGKKLLNPYH